MDLVQLASETSISGQSLYRQYLGSIGMDHVISKGTFHGKKLGSRNMIVFYPNLCYK